MFLMYNFKVTFLVAEYVALVQLCYCCRVAVGVLCLFLVIPWDGLWYVIVVVCYHTHLLFM